MNNRMIIKNGLLPAPGLGRLVPAVNCLCAPCINRLLAPSNCSQTLQFIFDQCPATQVFAVAIFSGTRLLSFTLLL